MKRNNRGIVDAFGNLAPDVEVAAKSFLLTNLELAQHVPDFCKCPVIAAISNTKCERRRTQGATMADPQVSIPRPGIPWTL